MRRRKWRLIVVLVSVVVLLGWDLARSPGDQWSGQVLVAGIDLYQATGSKLMPKMGVQCRFRPTCSHYAKAVIQKDGAVAGSLRAARRILRCGPWTPAETDDPP